MGEQKWPHHSICPEFFTRSQSAMAFCIKSSNRCNCVVSWSQSLELPPVIRAQSSRSNRPRTSTASGIPVCLKDARAAERC